jgi:hypothetical protein
MKARISKWGSKILSNKANAYALVEAIIEQGAKSAEGKGIIEFTVTSDDNPHETKTEHVKILSSSSINS